MLCLSRYLALLFAIGLALGEAVHNWGDWQYAPLWIIDYLIVASLLAGFWRSRDGRSTTWLSSAWALTAGVFYMALFISLDPDIPFTEAPPTGLLVIMGVLLAVAILGWIGAVRAAPSNFA